MFLQSPLSPSIRQREKTVSISIALLLWWSRTQDRSLQKESVDAGRQINFPSFPLLFSPSYFRWQKGIECVSLLDDGKGGGGEASFCGGKEKEVEEKRKEEKLDSCWREPATQAGAFFFPRN